MASQETVPDAYDDLLEQYRRRTYVGDAAGVLAWDQQVTMPEGGTPARSKQSSALSAVHHDLLTAEPVRGALDDLEGADLPAPEAAVVREVRRKHERADKLPTALVEETAEAASNALPVWKEAKADDDFEAFAPTLENLLDLKRRWAEHIDPDRDPYEVLFEDYEPYLDLETAERVLERLRDELVPLVDAISATDADLATVEGAFPTGDQEALLRAVLDDLGYSWDRGRLDTAPHPFSSGTQFDARVTTRFDETDPMDALGSTIHEFGHATYTLGLPDDAYGTPLGESREKTIHESQSRLWENHVGRSRAFWDHVVPAVNDHLGTDLTAREGYEAFNQIYDDNLIRVEADELTYHMHIILRFEIERDLVRGDLDVAEVPAVWNDRMEEYLGVRPDTDAEGCLQDIHWSHGNFGYFPTYSLGSVLAAQLYDAASDDIDHLEGRVARGEFDALHDWLTEEIHRHGQQFRTDELIERATGEPFSADAFLAYAKGKFGDLYGVDV